MYHALTHWPEHHPYWFAFLLFLLSIYAGPIRRFLAIPPQKLNVWILKARVSNVTAALNRMETYKDNIYEVLLLLLHTLLLALSAILMTVVFHYLTYAQFVMGRQLSYQTVAVTSSAIIFVSVLAGLHLLSEWRFVLQLRYYPYRHAILNERLSRLYQRINRADVPRDNPFDT